MQVHREREDLPQAKPLGEIKAHLNIADHPLAVEGLDLHPAVDPVVDLVVGKHNSQLELNLISTYPVHDFPFLSFIQISFLQVNLTNLIFNNCR